jgi:hypothetical protein
MLSRREALRGGTASVAAIAAAGAVAGVAVPAMTDKPLFEAIRAFHETYEPTQRASAAYAAPALRSFSRIARLWSLAVADCSLTV